MQQEQEFIRLSTLLNVSALVTLGHWPSFATAAAWCPATVEGAAGADADGCPGRQPRDSDHRLRSTGTARRGPGRREDAPGTGPEIDSARQAHEGLEQRPGRGAIRAELADSHDTSVPGMDLSGAAARAGVMAGDWWSAQVLLDGQIALTITDVSGHGPEAGMEALRLKHVVELSLAQNADPALALKAGADGFRTASRFATCLIVVIEPQTGFLTWANAGHPPAWLVTPATTTELVTTGPLLSVLGGTWANQHSHLEIRHCC